MTLRGRARERRMKRSNGRTMVIAVPAVLVLLAGAVVFAAYRPHATAAACAVTIAAGAYEFRARAVDLNGYAQPEPRPYPKSGRNEIQSRPILVMG